MNGYGLRAGRFGEEIITKCSEFDENDISLIGFTHCFIQIYLPFQKEWLTSFTRVYQELESDGALYLVRCFVRNDGIVIYEGYGSSRELNRASDYACYHLSLMIRDSFPEFLMPPYLIGFPNIRGHCYLISAVMPILYSYPIVKAIFDGYQYYCLNANISGQAGYSHTHGRPVMESPFYWLKTLYGIFKDFHKFSANGMLPLVNTRFLQKKLNSHLKDNPDFPDKSVKPDADLKLDCRLIKGLCSSLATYCDRQFGTPGGDEGHAYRHIISKLVSQLPETVDDLMLSLEIKFYCGFCIGGPYESKFSTPIIKVPVGVEFQSLLNSPTLCANAQQFNHSHNYGDISCPGKARSAQEAKFLNRPQVLCFSVSAEASGDEVAIPSKLKFNFAGEQYIYTLLCSSVCIQCFKSEHGISYGEFYHPYEEGDEGTGWHTYIHMETQNGAFEVNNGRVYHVDTRIFKILTPSSIHFYQLEEFDEFRTKVYPQSLRSKPEYVLW